MTFDRRQRDLEALKAQIETLSPVAVRFVARMVDSLSSPAQANLNTEPTWITKDEDWIEYFSLALSVLHGTTTEPLGLTDSKSPSVMLVTRLVGRTRNRSPRHTVC